MKVAELYSLTKNIIFEKASSTIYDNYLIGNVNRVITELFNENNLCRMFNGKVPFSTIPLVENVDDDIDYENEYLYNVMPLGLAKYFMIDDDLNKYSLYSAEYNNARILHQKLVSQEVVNALTK